MKVWSEGMKVWSEVAQQDDPAKDGQPGKRRFLRFLVVALLAF
jgi:hypothetical protein